ncbi:hypothetical protein F8M41_013233 [Gigaspora margarita]|uniref:Uncharacterized protein n=1 Tax=Gigaspora margarita TaxID=4874 RepID=A0A8H3X037_GIGMA|nr:hypothetical protein F8M41_013233 [Gigaspora margarita]
MSNLTLSKELFDAQIELREKKRKQQEEYEQYRANLEDIKRKIEKIKAAALYLVLHLQEVIEEKDVIIQNTIAHYEARIYFYTDFFGQSFKALDNENYYNSNSRYISVEENEFNEYENLIREMNIDVIEEENNGHLSNRSISEYNDF